MNSLQLFSSEEFGSIRTLEQNGEPWFVGKDIAEALGYANTRKAIITHVDEEDKGVTKWDTLGGNQDLTIINESGMYSLIMGSKLPTANRFKRWVTSEVLPSIRKTGGYVNSSGMAEAMQSMCKSFEKVVDVVADLAGRVERLENSHSKFNTDNVTNVVEIDFCENVEALRIGLMLSGRRSRTAIDKMDEELRKEIVKMVIDGVTYKEITEFINANGYSLSTKSIERYGKRILDLMKDISR